MIRGATLRKSLEWLLKRRFAPKRLGINNVLHCAFPHARSGERSMANVRMARAFVKPIAAGRVSRGRSRASE